ncbi:MAG: ribonucleotide reductase subunit alpha [Halobacteriovoraceae bacterium]|jgi:hypothetical protein|nr:ribonucleotide reductase subunit alpha [Halobacteriovoraceae bacterium]MBT5093396.1 ribonucleotide reductase subunit alpha [Halobacteriovoraceae bacterium]
MSQFEQLLNRAKNEKQPQQVLLLFAKATDMFSEAKFDHQSGTIDSIMCVNKSPDELTNFKNLVSEADQFSKDWNFIFISTLSGCDNQGPSEKDIDLALHKMSNTFANGDDLSQFLVFNRDEQLVAIA